MQNLQTEAPFIFKRANIYHIKFDANKIFEEIKNLGERLKAKGQRIKKIRALFLSFDALKKE